jgi:hypothetical protein
MGNAFIGLPLGTLQSLQSVYIDCLTALASNQSYSLNGRSLTRVDLDKVQAALCNINAALAMAQGDTSSATYVSFTGI